METLVVQKQTFDVSFIKFIDTSSEHFSADDVIDAYFIGKEEGKSQMVNAYKLLLAKNLTKTIPLWDSVNKFIVKSSFDYINSFLKIVSINKFDILIVVSKDDFLKDSFLKIYEFASNIEETQNNKDYTLNFNFTFNSQEFNENCLLTEGYNLKFKPELK